MLILKIRLAKEFGIPPSEIGQRLSTKDIGQILAYERMEIDRIKEAQRAAELEAQAQAQRKKAVR